MDDFESWKAGWDARAEALKMEKLKQLEEKRDALESKLVLMGSNIERQRILDEVFSKYMSQQEGDRQ